MLYIFNHYYEIKNKATGRFVNVQGNHNNNILRNGEIVNLYERTDDPDQRWAFECYGEDGHVRIVLQRGEGAYALNYDMFNACCIIWNLNSAKDSDTVIQIIPCSDNTNAFYFMLSDRKIYLTAADNNLRWMNYTGGDEQLFTIQEPSNNIGTDKKTNILSKEITVPVDIASTPYIITDIPDKGQKNGLDKEVEYHPGCGFANGTNFNSSTAGLDVKNALQKYIKKVFGNTANLTDAQTCYYLYGERIANGYGNQFHPGVDINYYDNAPIYSIYAGIVVYSGGKYGTVSIKVPSQNNVVTNYIHMKGITVNQGDIVNAGQLIGHQGNTGTTSSHLHFEVRPAGAKGPAGSTYQPFMPMTTIRPYGNVPPC